jgi:hypothetical protein
MALKVWVVWRVVEMEEAEAAPIARAGLTAAT